MTYTGELLMGIDAGTTGCKVALFAPTGALLHTAYHEYNVQRPQPGWAELDAPAIWPQIKAAIRAVAAQADPAAIRAIAVSSMGEAVVPVTQQRAILGPSLLNWDRRGEEFLPALADAISNADLFTVNGNTLGNHYTLTKLLWLQKHLPQQYEQADHYLHWSGFIAFMLGAEAAVDYSLANRTLLFDLDARHWSPELAARTGLDFAKLPRPVPSGTPIGTVAPASAAELGLSPQTVIVSGAHDQNANAVGCGVIEPGRAVFGMGTYLCITPVYMTRPATAAMIANGLNTEHHALPDRFVSFIYNHGGSLVKWYRDTFAHAEHQQAQAAGRSVYPDLFAEVPGDPSRVLVLPHFAATGPPRFISDSSGVLVGLQLATSRGDILKGIIESTTYYLKEVVDQLPATGITIADYRTSGGGSQSDVWVQTCADIMGQPFNRPAVTEAGALGAAIMAGVGSGLFASYAEGVAAMVRVVRQFEPDMQQHARYAARYAHYKALWPLLADYLRDLTAANQYLSTAEATDNT